MKDAMDWQHLLIRFREGQPLLPELDGAHVAKRRVNPEVVVPLDLVGQLDLEVAEVEEALPVDELRPQHLVGRLVDRIVVGAALGGERPLDAEGLQHEVDLGVVDAFSQVSLSEQYYNRLRHCSPPA